MSSPCIDAASLQHIESTIRELLLTPTTPPAHLSIYRSHPLHRILSFHHLPDWVVKLHIQSPRAMLQREKSMESAVLVCKDRGWDRLKVPRGMCHTMHLSEGRQWTIWIEERLHLYPATTQEEWYLRNPDAFLPTLKQWALFLFVSDCTDVDWRNFPLLHHQHGIGLIDLDGFVLAEGMWASRALAHRTALIGNTCGSRGLLRCAHPQHIPYILDWAQPVLDNLKEFFPHLYECFLEEARQILIERETAWVQFQEKIEPPVPHSSTEMW